MPLQAITAEIQYSGVGDLAQAVDALDGTGGNTRDDMDDDFDNEVDHDSMLAYFNTISQDHVSCQTRTLRHNVILRPLFPHNNIQTFFFFQRTQLECFKFDSA